MTTARVPVPPTEQPPDFRVLQEQPSFGELPRPRVIATLAGVMSALLLAALDQTIVGTAMPRIVAELNGFEHYAWVTTAYLLTSTAGVPIFGKLSDLFGRKLFLLGGVALFVVASALCGAARGMTDLVLFRGLQGLGAGCTQAMVFTTIGDLFPPAQRGKLDGGAFNHCRVQIFVEAQRKAGLLGHGAHQYDASLVSLSRGLYATANG
jgi:hypothetical protein